VVDPPIYTTPGDVNNPTDKLRQKTAPKIDAIVRPLSATYYGTRASGLGGGSSQQEVAYQYRSASRQLDDLAREVAKKNKRLGRSIKSIAFVLDEIGHCVEGSSSDVFIGFVTTSCGTQWKDLTSQLNTWGVYMA
jgi:hypothetical protein